MEMRGIALWDLIGERNIDQLIIDKLISIQYFCGERSPVTRARGQKLVPGDLISSGVSSFVVTTNECP